MYNVDLSFFPHFGISVAEITSLIQSYFKNSLNSIQRFDYFLQLKSENRKNINIYNTGRLLFQGAWADWDVIRLVDFLLNKTNVCDFDVCIGSDEAGKGEAKGGLVVVAFGIKRADLSKLIVIGAVDSKRLRVDKLSKVARQISSLGIYVAEKLDSKQFNTKWRQIGNLNSLLEELHKNAIVKLLEASVTKWKEAQKYAVFVDKFRPTQSSIGSSVGRLANLGIFIKHFEEHKAEKYPVVGAASILAKVFYEKALKKDKGLKDYKNVS